VEQLKSRVDELEGEKGHDERRLRATKVSNRRAHGRHGGGRVLCEQRAVAAVSLSEVHSKLLSRQY